jgi:hypothetical protein|nr:MAG TPA: structural protein [Caudoviricetes sp.]
MSRQFLAGAATVDMLVGDQLIATATTLLDSSITVGSTAEEVRGGPGAKLLGKYYHTSTFDINLTDVLFKLEYFAFQTGSAIQQIADVFTSEQVTLGAGGSGTITGTPAVYQSYGTIGWAAKPGSDAYQKITFTEKAFTVAGAKEGDIYCVKYISTDNAARQITISSSFIPSEVTLVMTANLYRAGGRGENDVNNSSKIGIVQVLVPRFQFNGSMELSMTSTGVANSPIAGSALDNPSADCSDGGYYAIITEQLSGSSWYDNVFALAIEDSDIELATTTGTATLSVYALPLNGAAFKPPYEDLTFTSAANGTATVTQEGVVTGVAQGSTTVTVSIKNKAGVEAIANITVPAAG